MQKQLLSLVFFLVMSFTGLAQFSDIRGQILNANPDGDTLKYVSLLLKYSDATAGSIVTDGEGRFIFSNPIVFQLNVTNVLNTRNVYNVYAYSSLPNNDGFLSSPQGQQQINNELSAQSYVDYYNLKQNNPGNFGNPRVVSLTIRSSF